MKADISCKVGKQEEPDLESSALRMAGSSDLCAKVGGVALRKHVATN